MATMIVNYGKDNRFQVEFRLDSAGRIEGGRHLLAHGLLDNIELLDAIRTILNTYATIDNS